MKRKYILIGSLTCFILLFLISSFLIIYRRNRTIYIQDIKQYTKNINIIKENIKNIDDETCKETFQKMLNRINDTHFSSNVKLSTYYHAYHNGASFLDYYNDVINDCNIEEDNSIYIDALISTNYPNQIKKEFELSYQLKLDDIYSNNLINKSLDKNGTYSTKTLELRVIKKLLDEVANE